MILRPTRGFVFAHPAHFIALGFGTGLAPIAPGTAGTLLAFPLFILLDWLLPPLPLFARSFALFFRGHRSFLRNRRLGLRSHRARSGHRRSQRMNWDEVSRCC